MNIHRLPLLFWMMLMTASSAHAHGGEILFFPLGQILALVAIVCVAAFMHLGQLATIAAMIVGIVGAIVLWFLPRSIFPEQLRYSGLGYFLSGVIPAMLFGFIVVALKRKRGKNDI